jgi:hypothetical protein
MTAGTGDDGERVSDGRGERHGGRHGWFLPPAGMLADGRGALAGQLPYRNADILSTPVMWAAHER